MVPPRRANHPCRWRQTGRAPEANDRRDGKGREAGGAQETRPGSQRGDHRARPRGNRLMDLMNIMRMAQEAKKNSDQIQSDLEQMTITGAAGGGMVSAEVSGLGIVKRVKIDRSVVNPDDVEMLEDLVTVAVSEAQKKAQNEQKLRM